MKGVQAAHRAARTSLDRARPDLMANSIGVGRPLFFLACGLWVSVRLVLYVGFRLQLDNPYLAGRPQLWFFSPILALRCARAGIA